MIPLLTDGTAGEAVTASVSMETLLERRNAAVERLAVIARAVREYGEIGEALGLGSHEARGHYKFRAVFDRHSNRHLEDDRWLEEATATVDAALWDSLLDRSGLRTFMDAKARKEWDDQIDKLSTPALTDENVRATFARLHGMRGELFERGVLELFRRLSWDYATNQPQKLGKRIILRGVMDGWGYPGRTDELDDLERAMHVLDGKPEPDHRNGVQARLRKRASRTEALVDDYLKVRTFKNGNGHVELLRPDLVDELNRILAKHHPNALAPAREAA